MALIVEDPEIQAGAAVFRGTRILVCQIADLIAAGASDEELRDDYPRLTRRMLAAAHLFAAGVRAPRPGGAALRLGSASWPAPTSDCGRTSSSTKTRRWRWRRRLEPSSRNEMPLIIRVCRSILGKANFEGGPPAIDAGQSDRRIRLDLK